MSAPTLASALTPALSRSREREQTARFPLSRLRERAGVRAVAAATLLLVLSTPAFAISSPAEMLPDRAMELRAEHVGHELRCLVCQNESIEESDADLARDLRKIIRQHVAAGQSNREIVAWMVARYGNFVRLRPPFDWATMALWGSPVIAVLVGGGAAFVGWRQRRRTGPPPLTDAEREKLAELLHS